MEMLRRMAVFATVVEQGSMIAASRELGMTPSAVSQHISKLEAEHGVSLLHRTTRSLTLTEAGSLFYQGFAGPMLTEALAPLLAAHPRLSLKLFFHDEMIDLVQHRIDLALRAGDLKDSSLVARHLADWDSVLCAAPAYLARHAPIIQPQQLTEHQWVMLDHERSQSWLSMENAEGVVVRPEVGVRVSSNNILAARQFVLAGMGLSIQPEPEIRQELADGRLLRILPEWRLPALGIYVVTPRRDAQPAKVRYAIDALRQRMQHRPAVGA
ncbi:LysR family transcriptional regulator [Aquitalea palustris]|uniref:LysR family transcriptional regulator n=1 Tax=Aquitalea palustris TaxID=2480983 RepID=A0A454JCX8_9NEIS|nr:LysR family transcriptional regulator [Aquitalea palustris]RMC90814.1 LysR family transcriptional regulator [Aquitalea palustris]